MWIVFRNPFTLMFHHTAALCLQLLKQKCSAHPPILDSCMLCVMEACLTCQVLFHSFLCCCHYSVVCKKSGLSPYGSPSKSPMGGQAGMLALSTVVTKYTAWIPDNP
jgi:hypothetical protein